MNNNNFVKAELAFEQLNKEPQEPKSTPGDLPIRWIYEALAYDNLDTGRREYQREKVATEDWKQAIIYTILTSEYARIPQVHIRVIVLPDESLRYELVDGQQRCTAITDFISGGFLMPECIIDGQELTGKRFSELDKKLQDKILDYRIQCIWYEGIDDQMTADLFVKVLNNTINLNHQEMRNALRSFLITYVRDLARPARGMKTHPLFERVSVKDSKGNPKDVLTQFKLNLKGRMELDEWILECCHFVIMGPLKGLTQTKLTKWVEQQHKDEYSSAEKFAKHKAIFDRFFNHVYECVRNTPSEHKEKLNGMTTQMFALFGWELLNEHGQLDYAKYAKAWFDVYHRWNTDEDFYKNETECNGNQLQQFRTLFNGKNGNAISTIWKILNIEKENGLDFGTTQIDPRKTFTKADILKKWEEQGFKDGYDGEELSADNLAGDHDIPRSWGVESGGVTEYDNLVVTSEYHNRRKGNMSGVNYRTKLLIESQKKVA